MDVTIHVTRGCLDCTSYLPVWFKIGALHRSKHIRWRVDTGTDQAPDLGSYAH